MKERKAFLMRIDPALWAELESWAQEELRSVNGQIEMILRQAIQKRKGPRTQLNSPSMKQEGGHVSTK
ncbi:MAG TPA: hypothetical protein VHX63_04750 [Acidobacteriaceae bacterium]|jgi:hypothetical protein|nr:hypothetical protein [Acidobacteriaceae bacterium]